MLKGARAGVQGQGRQGMQTVPTTGKYSPARQMGKARKVRAARQGKCSSKRNQARQRQAAYKAWQAGAGMARHVRGMGKSRAQQGKAKARCKRRVCKAVYRQVGKSAGRQAGKGQKVQKVMSAKACRQGMQVQSRWELQVRWCGRHPAFLLEAGVAGKCSGSGR